MGRISSHSHIEHQKMKKMDDFLIRTCAFVNGLIWILCLHSWNRPFPAFQVSKSSTLQCFFYMITRNIQYTYYIYLSICWLVVWNHGILYDFPFSWEFPSIPTDELKFFLEGWLNHQNLLLFVYRDLDQPAKRTISMVSKIIHGYPSTIQLVGYPRSTRIIYDHI
jgi:hypothetical protein